MRATKDIPGYRKASGKEVACCDCKYGKPAENAARQIKKRMFCNHWNGMGVGCLMTCDFINRGKKNGKASKKG